MNRKTVVFLTVVCIGLVAYMAGLYAGSMRYAMTEAEKEAVFRTSMLTAQLGYDWQIEESPDRQHMVGYYNSLSDTLYSLLLKHGHVGRLLDE